MIEIAKLVRSQSTNEGTFGRLVFGQTSLFSLELPWRDNKRQRSCIPPGAYRCDLVNSPRFGRVYGVSGVPGRTHVLIHSANLAGDVEMGYVTQLHGCIAPCEKRGRMKTANGNWQQAGLLSRSALSKLTTWAADKPFILEIFHDFSNP